jgi:hypothetical protein
MLKFLVREVASMWKAKSGSDLICDGKPRRG